MNKNIFDRFNEQSPHFLKVMHVHTNILYEFSIFSVKTYPLIVY